MRPVRPCLPLLMCIAALFAACVPIPSPLSGPPAGTPAPPGTDQDLHVLPADDPIDTRRLNEVGVTFTPADPARAKRGITREQAIARAWAGGPKASGEVIAAADLGYLGGGTRLGALTPERLVWLVGFTGPGIVATSSGPPGAPHVIGHEYVSIVDAASGEVLVAATCCVIHDQGVPPLESCTQPPGLASFSFSCEAALQRAMEAAGQSRPALGIQQARIDSLSAELMTYATADRQFSFGAISGQDPNGLVWLVRVIGAFRFEGMAATGASQAPIYEAKERDFLYDALTGQELMSRVPKTTLAEDKSGLAEASPAAPPGPAATATLTATVLAPTAEPADVDLSAFRLLVSADPSAGPAPLKVRLHGTLIGGPDNSRDLYCAPAKWDFDDGKTKYHLPDCLVWTPDAAIQRSWETEYAYARAGSYRVRLSIFAGATALSSAVTVTVTASATATPAPTPTLAPGFVGDGYEGFDIQFTRPESWELCQVTELSRAYCVQASQPSENPIAPPAFYFTLLPPGFLDEDGSAYNRWGAEDLTSTYRTEIGQQFDSLHQPAGYNTYTRLPDVTVDGLPGLVVENESVWEARAGMKDRRVLIKMGEGALVLGTYYLSEEDLRTFEQVLASVKFGSIMRAKAGATGATPAAPTR